MPTCPCCKHTWKARPKNKRTAYEMFAFTFSDGFVVTAGSYEGEGAAAKIAKRRRAMVGLVAPAIKSSKPLPAIWWNTPEHRQSARDRRIWGALIDDAQHWNEQRRN